MSGTLILKLNNFVNQINISFPWWVYSILYLDLREFKLKNSVFSYKKYKREK